MLRTFMMSLAPLALLLGCQSTEPRTQSATVGSAAGHGAFVASLNGDFIWDCSLTAPASGFPANFVIQRQETRLRPVIFMVTAAGGLGDVVTVEKDDFARIYSLRDSSRILVASDGGIFGLDRRGEPIASSTIGRCNKGLQAS